MSVLRVSGLRKAYPSFLLDDVSFELEAGKITGFIGRNGAGKSTTLNSLFNFVHPDGGEISFFGLSFGGNELAIKQRVGFLASGVNYYPKKKLRSISAVTASFYDSWDEAAYQRYCRLFALDTGKTPEQLSAGMKVKYALTLALSHNAELLILDEPTSGLDPVSREELLDIFMELCDEGKTILFSTHITSDLDKCADNILYIQNGRLLADCGTREFENSYRLVFCADKQQAEQYQGRALGLNRVRDGYTLLLKAADAPDDAALLRPATLEAIMIHLEKGARTHA